jgi:hypothetical protein
MRTARGELVLTTWLGDVKRSDTEVSKLISLVKKYESLAPETASMSLNCDYLDAADDVLHLIPEGVDDFWCNAIMDMFELVNPDRIRRCRDDKCKRWFYAHRARKLHCNNTCRDRARMGTREYQERKRESMRKLRRTVKEMAAKKRAYRERAESERVNSIAKKNSSTH